jgi:hypothetical protein
MVILQNRLDGIFRNNPVCLEPGKRLLAYDNTGQAQDHIIEVIPVRLYAIPYLFFKPAHVSPPQSVSTSLQ